MRNKYSYPKLNSFTVCFDKQNNFSFVCHYKNSEKQRVFKYNKNNLENQETFRTYANI